MDEGQPCELRAGVTASTRSNAFPSCRYRRKILVLGRVHPPRPARVQSEKPLPEETALLFVVFTPLSDACVVTSGLQVHSTVETALRIHPLLWRRVWPGPALAWKG